MVISEETRRKMSEARSGEKHHYYGKHRSEETKRKISLAHAGKKRRPMSEETKKKISEANKGRKREPFSEEWRKKLGDSRRGKPNPHSGWKLSEETRQRMSLAQRGPNNPMKGRVGSKNPNWHGGASFGKYCPRFNNAFKEHIREKFGRKCYLCPKTEEQNGRKLCVHHIDYAKNSICNGKEWAFVPLCHAHHLATNFDRWYWFNLLINYWAMNPEINF